MRDISGKKKERIKWTWFVQAELKHSNACYLFAYKNIRHIGCGCI